MGKGFKEDKFHSLTPKQIATFKDMYEQPNRYSNVEIGTRFRISPSRVGRWAKRFGLTPRENFSRVRWPEDV